MGPLPAHRVAQVLKCLRKPPRISLHVSNQVLAVATQMATDTTADGVRLQGDVGTFADGALVIHWVTFHWFG